MKGETAVKGDFDGKEKKEPAWYERSSDDAWYKEKSSLPEDAATVCSENSSEPVASAAPAERKNVAGTELNDLFDGGRVETKSKKRKSEENEKIYRSEGVAPLKEGGRENEKEYIAQNFELNPAVKRFKKGGKSGAVFVLGLLLAFAVALVSLQEARDFPLAAWIGCGFAAVLVVFLIAFFIGKRNVYKSPEKFFLVSPYAVKPEYGALHKLDGCYVYTSGSGSHANTTISPRRRKTYSGESEDIISLADCGLRIYYEIGGKKREAETEKIYTEEQIAFLIDGFRAGTLVVSCRKKCGKKSDAAVICEPFLPVYS